MVLYDPNDSRLGRSLLELSGLLVAEHQLAMVFSDTFAKKATPRGGRGRGGKGSKGDKGNNNKRKWDESVDPKRAEALQLLKAMPKDCVSRMPKTRQFLCVLFQHGKCPHQSKERCDRGLHNCWHKDCLRKGVPYCECKHS